MKKNITYKELHRQLHYNPITGIFIRLISNTHTVKVGDIAGCRNNGYIEITINNKKYRAHRLAWLYVHGYFPEKGIDHEDRIRHHNWIDNLREKSQSCNMRNTGNPKNNTSGIKGVYWDKDRDKWHSQITINRKTKALGRYKSLDNAVCARLAAEQYLNWSNCDSSSPAYQYVQKMLKEKING